MKIKNLLLALFALPLLFVACDKDNPVVDEVKEPTVAVTAGEATEATIAFTVTSTDAEKVAYLVVEGTEAPTASEVLTNGTEITANKEVTLTATELKAETEYTIVAAAQNSKAVVKASASKTTLKGGDEPGPGPGPDPGPTDAWVAEYFYADYDDSEGMNIYSVMFGDKEFGDKGWGVDGGTYYTLYFVSASKGGGKLPKGTYTVDSSYSAGTIIVDYSYRHQMENGQLKYGMEAFRSGTLTISDGKIEADLEIDRDGSVVKVVYEGDLSVDDGSAPVQDADTLVADKWLWGGSSTYGNKYMVAGESFSVDVHFQPKNANESSIVAGEYTWTSTSFWGYNDFEEFTTRTFTVDGVSVAVDGGMAVVNNDGDMFDIELTLEGRDGVTYVIVYEGKLNDKGEDDGGDDETAMVVTSLSEGDHNTSYGFYTYKGEGEGFTFDLLVNDYQSAANRIDAGSYSYAPMKSFVGSNGYFFVDNFLIDGIKYKPMVNSTMTVEGDGTNVKIAMNLHMESGDQFEVVFEGAVGGSNDNVEVTKLATPTVMGMVSGNAATVSWNEIAGAKDYTVTLNGADVQTVTTAYVVYQDLAYSTTYSVSVVANPADTAVNSASDAGTATFTTEADPNGGGDEGGNEGGSTTQSFENWVFDATLDMGSLLVTMTDGSHTVTCTLNMLAGGTFYFNGTGAMNAIDVKVNGVAAESASGTLEISTNQGYRIVLDAEINGVKYTGTSTNPVV